MIELRDYQVTIVDQLRESLKRNQRTIAVAPTGSGKRIIACWLSAAIAEKGKRVAVVTDRRILVQQMADECREHGIRYGMIMGNSPRNEEAPLQICSIQTLQIRKWKDMPDADVVIIDEAHKATQAYQEMLLQLPDAKVISFTATPVGSEGVSLVPVLGPIVEPYKNEQLIKEGWLLPTRVYAPSEPDIRGVTVGSNGEFSQNQVGERVEECTVFADVFKWWKPFSDERTIVFVPRVKFAHSLAEEFEERGFTAGVITGKVQTPERDKIVRGFEEGSVRVLINVQVLTEGFDCPAASVGIDLTPNKQFRTFWQKVGRVKRPAPGKDHAVWLDFSGNIWRHTHPDVNPEWPVNEHATIEESVRESKEKKESEPWCCPECAHVLAFWERLRDGECPNCGRKPKQMSRRIRMGNGRMKRVPIKEQKKAKKSYEQQEWDRCRYIAHYKRLPLLVAAKMYEKKIGTHPGPHLNPKPPEHGASEWGWRVADVYPFMNRGSR